MSVMMPKPSEAILGRRQSIVDALRAIVPGEGVVDAANEMAVFESDGGVWYGNFFIILGHFLAHFSPTPPNTHCVLYSTSGLC